MESLTGASTRKPDIAFYRNGTINISARISRILCIADGDIIDICRNGMEYYLYVRSKGCEVMGHHMGVCRRTNPNTRNYRAHSVVLCGRVMDIVGCSDVVRLVTGEEVMIDGRRALTLIMRNRT